MFQVSRVVAMLVGGTFIYLKLHATHVYYIDTMRNTNTNAMRY